jgi:hypothetical protein
MNLFGRRFFIVSVTLEIGHDEHNEAQSSRRLLCILLCALRARRLNPFEQAFFVALVT